jgi:hypothetical protein
MAFPITKKNYRLSKKEKAVVGTIWGAIKIFGFMAILFILWVLSHF